MKLFKVLAVLGALTVTGAASANNHEVCTGKDGKKIEAKDKADCEHKGGTWGAEKK